MSVNLFPERATKTILADYNDIESRIPGTYQVFPETTINTKYNVFNSITDITSPPPIAYYGVGIKGSYFLSDNGIQMAPYEPKPDELDMYFSIPLRLVPISEDLSTAERAKYRMRVRQTYNGQSYWAYYLKCLENVDNSARIVRVDPVSSAEIAYEFSTSQLTPEPKKPTTSGVQDGSMTDVMVVKSVKAVVTGAEILEAINVMFNGDMSYARISEWGLYSGIDRVVESVLDGSGSTIRYTEACYCQLSYHLCNTGSTITGSSTNIERVFTFGNGKLLLQSA